MKVPAEPTVNVALLALRDRGGLVYRQRENSAVIASVPKLLCAVNEIGNVPLAVAVPLSTPVLELNATPFGSVPDSLRVGVGDPVAVTVKVPAEPTVNVALPPLVIAEFW